MPLVTGIELPDYLTAPVAYHGTLPGERDHSRSPLAQTARTLVSQALTILHCGGVRLAGYAETHHCVVEGAHVDSQILKRDNRANVVLGLETVHFDGRLNPRSHPGYPALRAARVAEINRWGELFRAEGWTVREVHDATPNYLGFVLTAPTA